MTASREKTHYEQIILYIYYIYISLIINSIQHTFSDLLICELEREKERHTCKERVTDCWGLTSTETYYGLLRTVKEKVLLEKTFHTLLVSAHFFSRKINRNCGSCVPCKGSFIYEAIWNCKYKDYVSPVLMFHLL